MTDGLTVFNIMLVDRRLNLSTKENENMAYDYNYKEAVKDDLVDFINSEYMDRLGEFEDLEE